jgi:hypothetical protein
MFNNDVYIIVSDLNYDGEPDRAVIISRQAFYRLKRWNGRHLKTRCSRERYEQVESRNFREQYHKAIMKKYNVGRDYEQNEYFMEQVRPTLY